MSPLKYPVRFLTSRLYSNLALSVLMGVTVACPLHALEQHNHEDVSAETRNPNAPPASATKKEIELGKKEAEKLEKDPRLKLWDGDKDPKAKEWLNKLDAMAIAFGKVSARPLIKYRVKVYDDKDINAFTLPNGHIYFSSGLIEAAGSDDEVASVLAHEIGHNVKMHVIRGEAKNKPLQWVGLAAMLAALRGGEAGTNVAQIAPYILTGVANSYSVAYEKEADEIAVELMSKTTYNPSALVSFMNRLALEERRRPEVQLGIYQTHPLSAERSNAALLKIAKSGLTYTPRAVTGSKESVAEILQDRVQIVWGDSSLMEFFPTQTPTSTRSNSAEGGKSEKPTDVQKNANSGKPQEVPAKDATTTDATAKPAVVLSPEMTATKKRAELTVTQLNSLMRDNLRLYEVSVQQDATGASLVARGRVIASATVVDALALKTTPLALARTWRSNLQRLFWKEVTGGAL